MIFLRIEAKITKMTYDYVKNILFSQYYLI